MRIGIVGGGIAGLTAALALARHGFASTVLEASPLSGTLGAGLQLAPNATRLLGRLGLLDEIRAVASEPETLRLRDGRDGRSLGTVPLGRAMRERYGSPYLTLARADLQSVLLASVRAQASIALRLDARVERLEEMEGAVGVLSGATALCFDLLLAADGVHSAIRTEVLNQPPAIAIGSIAWRSTIPSADLPVELRDDVSVLLAPGAHAVLYPIRAGMETNVVIVAGEGRDAASPVRLFPETLARTALPHASWTRWPLLVSDPRLPWVKGRIALVGDAAHAMAPSAAQGAAQAMEDSLALADALARLKDDPEGALRAWEERRKARVVRVAREAGRNLRTYGLGGAAASARNLALRLMTDRLHLVRLDWLYGTSG